MLVAWLLSYAGFCALCLSLDRHCQDLFGRKPTAHQRLALRLGGWVLLGLSLVSAVMASGWSFGLVEWTAVLMGSALLLVLLLPYRPRVAFALAAASLLGSPLATVTLL